MSDEKQQLPPFNESSRCIKCGWIKGPEVKPGVQFCQQVEGKACPAGYPHEVFGEHFHRQCPRCSYVWAEAALPESEQQRLFDLNIEESPDRNSG